MAFNKHKIYRVRKITNSLGETFYKVEAADSWIEGLFGIWHFYSKENESLDDAIEQIRILSKWRTVINKIVYKTRLKK